MQQILIGGAPSLSLSEAWPGSAPVCFDITFNNDKFAAYAGRHNSLSKDIEFHPFVTGVKIKISKY